MTLRFTLPAVLVALSLGLPGGGSPASAGCLPAHKARAVVQKYKLKGVARIAGRVPGKILAVQLCSSGKGFNYKVRYKKSGKNIISVMEVPAG